MGKQEIKRTIVAMLSPLMFINILKIICAIIAPISWVMLIQTLNDFAVIGGGLSIFLSIALLFPATFGAMMVCSKFLEQPAVRRVFRQYAITFPPYSKERSIADYVLSTLGSYGAEMLRKEIGITIAPVKNQIKEILNDTQWDDYAVATILLDKQYVEKAPSLLNIDIDTCIDEFKEKWPFSFYLKSNRPFDPQIICVNGVNNVAMYLECLGKKEIKITKFRISEVELTELYIEPINIREKVFQSRKTENLALGGVLIGGVSGL